MPIVVRVRSQSWQTGLYSGILSAFGGIVSGTELYRFFGHVARAMARREGSFGLRMLAFDPFVGELIMPEYDVVCATLLEVLQQSDFVSMHAPGEAGDAEYAERNTFSANEEAGDLHQYRPRPYRRDEAALIKALQEGWIAGAGLILETEPPPHQFRERYSDGPRRLGVSPFRSRAQTARRTRVGFGA